MIRVFLLLFVLFQSVSFAQDTDWDWARIRWGENPTKRTAGNIISDPEPAPVKSQVKPLLGDIYWDQYSPWNEDCPTGVGGTRCRAGCVATALGMIMEYWQYPASGFGSHTYAWDGDSTGAGETEGQNLSATFSDEYDWEEILGRYNIWGTGDLTAIASADQRAAVAELCYEIGVAIEMDYGTIRSSSYAGAMWDSLAGKVINRHFGYASGARRLLRSDYDSTAWFEILQAQLNLGRPILYRINDHAVVCDGWRVYNGRNQLHFNYGLEINHADRTGWWYVNNLPADSIPELNRALVGIHPSTLFALTKPGSGATIYVANEDTIKWSTANFAGHVRIEWDRNYPSGNWELITQSTPNNGVYLWKPSVSADSARIRLMSAAHHFLCDTSAPFTVELSDSVKFIPFAATASPTADAHISKNYTTRNYGISTALYAGVNSDTMQSQVYFPLAYEDCCIVITEGLFGASAVSVTDPTNVSVFKAASDWVEGTQMGAIDTAGACWDWRGWSKFDSLSVTGDTIDRGHSLWDRPMNTMCSGNANDTVAIANDTNRYSWTITSLVQSLVNDPLTNFGLIIKKSDSTSNRSAAFSSRQNVQLANWPSLSYSGYYIVALHSDSQRVYWDTTMYFSEDAHIASSAPTSEWGARDSITVGYSTTGPAQYIGFFYNSFALLHNRGIVINDAKFGGYIFKVVGTPLIEVHVTNCLWKEGDGYGTSNVATATEVCWNWTGYDAPNDVWCDPRYGSQNYGTQVISASDTGVVWFGGLGYAINEMVADSTKNFGLAVLSPEYPAATRYVYFNSSEGVEAKRPRIYMQGYIIQKR